MVDRKIYLFGANRTCKPAIELINTIGHGQRLAGIIDNNTRRWSGVQKYCGLPVYSPMSACESDLKNGNCIVFIMTCMDSAIPISKQLMEINVFSFLFWPHINKLPITEVKSIFELENDYEILTTSLRYEKDVYENQVKFLTTHTNAETMSKASGSLREHQLALAKLGSDFCNLVDPWGVKPYLTGGNLLGYRRHNGFIPWDDDLDLCMPHSEYDIVLNKCKETQIYYEYDGEYNTEKIYEWTNRILKVSNGEMIFIKTPMRFRLFRGTKEWDTTPFIDIIPIDCYKESVVFSDHLALLDQCARKLAGFKTIAEQKKYVEEMRKMDEKDRDENGPYLYQAVDVWGSMFLYPPPKWCKREDVFPLVKVDYEGYGNYYVPCKIDNHLRDLFGDSYMSIPPTAALHVHGRVR